MNVSITLYKRLVHRKFVVVTKTWTRRLSIIWTNEIRVKGYSSVLTARRAVLSACYRDSSNSSKFSSGLRPLVPELNGEWHEPTVQSGLTSRVNCHSDLSRSLPEFPSQSWTIWTPLVGFLTIDNSFIRFRGCAKMIPINTVRYVPTSWCRDEHLTRLKWSHEKKKKRIEK